jgi:chromosome segregation ATPase
MTGKPTRDSMTPRRDPRADPDDDIDGTAAVIRPPSSQRIDVVNMDRTGDSISAVANTMRRELAKLHQQASAFERTLEDQRQERAEALDRAEKATEHALSLEARIARIEQENQQLRRMHETALDDLEKMRGERDDLSRAALGAKQSTEDIARLEADLASALAAREEIAINASALEAELAEVRKREHQEAAKGSDKDAEIAGLREKVERLTAELGAATGLAARAQSELVTMTQQRDDATSATAKAKEIAEHERVSSTAERDRLEKQLATARAAEAELVRVRQSLESAEKAVEQAVSETTRLAREVDAARQERDAHVERAAMIERENIDLRFADEQMRRQLDGALQAAMHAEARAGVAERARIQVEDGVRQLRDEITTAFARIRLVAPSLAPPPAEPLSARIAASVPPPPRPPGEYTPTPTSVMPSVLYGPDSANARPSARPSSPVSRSVPAPATRAATPLARRDELIAKLNEPNDARNAADALKTATEWLRGAPTKELLETLSHADYDAERPVFEVARAWEREPLCRAILDQLKSERDARAREHHAWCSRTSPRRPRGRTSRRSRRATGRRPACGAGSSRRSIVSWPASTSGGARSVSSSRRWRSIPTRRSATATSASSCRSSRRMRRRTSCSTSSRRRTTRWCSSVRSMR